ncbi:hypothetical protein [Actinomadura algeriensis]|uniref:DUF2207 domain-containing protein n=1 Tax=Actinomadura algeriensis TaxID=1679523 RepID=A0ABR9JLM4_9ACTN|nr:hypothetical protein [Actinomadura algeriensis]MBE1531456.1 hypothetical protein [Actinomadura algeriensis]
MSPAARRVDRWRVPEREGKTENNANDNSRVGVQGIVHGDVHLYEVREDDEPDRTLEVARNCLAGDMPRRTERLLGELAGSGRLAEQKWRHLTSEVAYHWAVAVLSDFPFDLLDNARLRDVDAACALARGGPKDEWRASLDVIVRLIGCLLARERTAGHDTAALDAVFADFDRLPDRRRAEIHRNLDPMLTGVAQDRIDARFADLVRSERTANGREDRVWKFFEPAPAPPRRLEVRSFESRLSRLTMSVCGPILASAGFTLAFAMVTLQAGWGTALFAGVLLLGALGLGCAFAPALLPRRYSPFPARRPVAGQTAFSRHVARCVEAEFVKRAPDGAIERSAWMLATRQQRAVLTNEVGNMYAEPEVETGAIDWLIAWHAREAARDWKEGHRKARLRLPAWMPLIVAGVLTLWAGLTVLNEMLVFQPGVAAVVAGWSAVGVLLAVGGRVDVLFVTRFHGRRAEETADRRLAEETEAYEARVALLRDRPRDTEMARWLDYDKIHLKSLAMEQYGLGNRDVLAFAVLTEAAADARRARVRNGPPRFSAYTVWVFLLTSSGVHQVGVHLDFPTGIAKDQDRTAFRYDALAAARVTESGFRFDDGRRRPILPEPGRDDPRDRSSFILYQKFRITLVSGHHVDITVENLDAWVLQGAAGDERTDADAPPPGEGDLSGALRLLEAAAADGREWIGQVKSRQERRLRNSPGAGPRRHGGDTEFP